MSEETNNNRPGRGSGTHSTRSSRIRKIAFLLAVVAMAVGVVAHQAPASGKASGNATPVFVTQIPDGYRNWAVISVAHEEGSLHSLGAVLGNDIAIKSAREGKLPYPDGSIIAALHWHNTPSEENDKIFGQPQSFVPGAPTNIQFMIKDSVKYAATGGWGFGHFAPDGKPAAEAFMQSCYPCHAKTPSTDLVFTHYAP